MLHLFSGDSVEDEGMHDPAEDFVSCTRCGYMYPYYCLHYIGDEMLCDDCYEELLREEKESAEKEEQNMILNAMPTPAPDFSYDFNAVFLDIANNSFSSICCIGVVFVRKSEIVGKYGTLVHPKPDDYDEARLARLGLFREDLEHAPDFRKAWNKIRNEMKRYPLAVYGVGFHKQCLHNAYSAYRMDWPEYLFMDVRRGAKSFFKKTVPDLELRTVAQACGYDLPDYHDSVACAEACALIAMKVDCSDISF